MGSRLVTIACAWALAASLSHAPSAHAEEDEGLFASASEAYRGGDFERAAELFRAAFEASPSANTKFNEAQSLRRSGAKAAAADAYEEAMRLGGLDAASSETSHRKLAELDREVGVLVVQAAPGTTIDIAHLRRAQVPARVRLDPGTHELRLEGPDGRITSRTVTARAGVVHRLEVTDAPEAPITEASVTAASERVERSDVQTPIGWITFGLGAGGGVVAVLLGARFLSVLDDYEATGYTDTSLESEALALRGATNVVAIASSVFVVTGLVLVLTAPTESTAIAVEAGGPLGSAGSTLTVRW